MVRFLLPVALALVFGIVAASIPGVPHDRNFTGDRIHLRLDAEGLEAKVVYSAGRFLDFLPIRSGKGGAVRYLAEALGMPASAVVTSGDTGNDLDMMRPELGFRGIAVGNSAPELAEYREPNVYHAEQAYAAGIREGLVHYGWLEPADGNP